MPDLTEQQLHALATAGATNREISATLGRPLNDLERALVDRARVVKRLKQDFDIVIKATFLGAHGIPTEFKGEPDRYVDLVIEDMLPKVVAEGLADHIDVFCDRGSASQKRHHGNSHPPEPLLSIRRK